MTRPNPTRGKHVRVHYSLEYITDTKKMFNTKLFCFAWLFWIGPVALLFVHLKAAHFCPFRVLSLTTEFSNLIQSIFSRILTGFFC